MDKLGIKHQSVPKSRKLQCHSPIKDHAEIGDILEFLGAVTAVPS